MTTNGHLILDFSEERIALYCKGYEYSSEISVDDFLNQTNAAIESFKEEISDKNFECKDLIITLPLSSINHQIVTLPDSVSDKEKMIFLGLEINQSSIGKNFGIQRLEVTQREEAGQQLCDYLILAPKQDVYNKLLELSTAMELKIASIVPSFYLLGPEPANELRATAWVGEDRSEIVIWGKNYPLALSKLDNSGDQIGDINRFIVEYFDHVDNLTLSMVYLYGPRMRDSALGFGLTYPHVILDNPVKSVVNNLHKAPRLLNISKEIKLPKPPIPMTPRNITYIASAVAVAVLVFMTAFNQAKNFRLKRQLITLERQAAKYKKLLTKYKKLEKEAAELGAEREFYLDITKRRTPWQNILADISKLTPQEMWFERFNGSRNKILISGKARETKDVSALSINLNNKSKYLNEALILGTRDFEEGNSKYSEFQLTAKLKSPTGRFTEKIN